MNDNTKKIVKAIRSNNYQEFSSILCYTTDLDYETIDRELLIKRDFNIQIKINYCDNYQRDGLIKLIEEDILENYIYYNYFSILAFTLSKVRDKKKKSLYILKAFIMTPNEKTYVFKRMLENHNYLDEFIKYIIISDSRYLKAKAAIFLCDKLHVELFGTYKNLLEYVKKSTLAKKEKIEYLIELSKKTKEKELLAEIEDLIIEYSDLYSERLFEEVSHLDDELLAQSRIKQEDYIKTALSVIRDKNNGESYLLK